MKGLKLWLLLLLGVLLCAQIGCVRRKMTIRSQPEGALVYIDQQEVGHTPVTVPFTYYGTREFILEKDGYKTAKEKHRIRPPWYELPVLEFFSENVVPREIHDEREISFQLQPQTPTDETMLQQRAEQLRQNVNQGVVSPLINR
jgi:hypothetical protein